MRGAPRGQRNGAARLTPEKVRDIRQRREAGEYPTALAREFGVSKTAVVQAASGETWGWLD